MTETCNMVVDEKKIPRDWELSTLLPIYKEEGDPLECGVHRTAKVFERVGDDRCTRSFWQKRDHCIMHLWTWRRHLIGYQKKWLGGH